MMKLAHRLNLLGTESAFAVSSLAADWAKKGHKIYPAHLGDINIPPPAIIIETCQKVLARKNYHKYCPPAGIPLLREQLATLIGKERGVHYDPTQVSVQPGGKPVIGKFLSAVMNEGDEVLFPIPGFPIYESQIRYLGGIPKPYFYRCHPKGEISLELDSLAASISPQTRALILNNYHNPTGHAASAEELSFIAELANKHNLWVLSDDAYFSILYDDVLPQTILSYPGMQERTVILHTFSKKFAMTGWRLGAAIGPQNIIAAINTMNTNQESCTPHFIQQAIAEVLRDHENTIPECLPLLQKRRDTFVTGLNTIQGLEAQVPSSAFYVYCNVEKLMKNYSTVDKLMHATLEATGVSFCTSEHFGERGQETPPYIRFAFSSLSEDDIDSVIKLLKTYFES